MSKIKAKNTLYNDPRYDVVVDSRMLEQHLKEKDQQITELQKQLEEKTKTIQGLVETQKNLEESASYQMFLDIQKRLEEKEKEIEDLKRKVNCAVDDLRNIGMRFELETFRANKLQDELKSPPAEIVEKIRNMCCIEDKAEDGTFVLGINEKELDKILKEYGEE